MNLPSLHWQRQSRPDDESACSLLIALMRGLAALEVAAAHLRAEMFPGLREIVGPSLHYQLLAFATGFAHQAVVVFFLISGWLVGGSLLDKAGRASPAPRGAAATAGAPWRAYAIDRLTRLWTVLVPALCLMLLVGGLTGAIDPARASFALANDYSATTFIGNLVGLQTVLVKNFSGNYALWSLANETWYYVQFPLLLIVFTSRSRMRQAGAAAVLVLLAASLPFPITLYFALWLLGAGFSRIRIACGNALRAALLAMSAASAVYFRLYGSNDDLGTASFLQDLVISLPLLALLSSTRAPSTRRSPALHLVARTAHVLSEFSFTLYVTHLPVIKLLRHVGQQMLGRDRLSPAAGPDYAIYAGMLLVLLAAAWVSYLLFEAHTFRVRRAIKNALRPRPRQSKITSPSLK